jgi:hypothetical protein
MSDADLPENESWYVKDLGDPMFSSTELEKIRSCFLSEVRKAESPEGMALFIRHESARLHCEVKAYFSPAAASVARDMGAVPCFKPLPDGLSLAAGAEACWSILFPERS